MSKELLLVIEAVSNEKNIAKDTLFEAMEAALAMATKKKNSLDWDVRVEVDRKTGAYDTFRCWTVVADDAEIENPEAETTVSEAQKDSPEVQEGEVIAEPIPSIEFGRIAAQIAKQVIVQKVREAEREQMVKQYEKRMGELVNGTVKRVTRDNIFLDLGENAEGLLSRQDALPKEAFHMGDRVRACLMEIDRDARGPQLRLSRTSAEMLSELFKLEVPEIAEQLIEVKSVARDPGMRAKIAVKTNDGRIDPVGACVGMRGSRVQSISNELDGERVDIVLWDDSPAQFVINAMSPAEVVSIVVDEESHTMQVAVKEEQLSQAIGKGGQNVRLATQLTGWQLNVIADTEAEEQQEAEAQKTVQLFMTQMGLEEDIAAALVEVGFSTLEEVAYVPQEEFMAVGLFEEETVVLLQETAKNALLTKALSGGGLPAECDLMNVDTMDQDMASKLFEKGIESMETLAEQAVDDLTSFRIDGLDEKRAAELIMAARKPWFE